MTLDLALAFTAGLLTAGAPCVLPMLPVILGSSVGRTNALRPLCIMLGFVVSFAAMASGLALVAEATGLSAASLRGVGVVLLALFGIAMVWPQLFEAAVAPLGGLAQRVGAIGGSGPAGGFVLGLGLGAVWTPCAGPVLGVILTLIATAEDPFRAGGMLAAYAVGAGVPMLLIAYGGQEASRRVRGLARHARTLQRGFGGLIVLTAVAVWFQLDVAFAVWLGGFYPQGRTGL